MSLALIIGLYALELFGISVAVDRGLDHAARFPLAILSLILPIVVYSFIDHSLINLAVNRIGREWCETNETEFIRTLHFKSHFSVVHKRGGKTARQKFSVAFVFATWKVKEVHWL